MSQHHNLKRFLAAFSLLATSACGSHGTTFIGAEVAEGGSPSGANGGAPPTTETCLAVGPGDACTTLPDRRLPPLSVNGNQLLQSGHPYHLYAVSRSELLWGEQNRDGCNGDDHFHDADLEAIVSWNFNAVRVGLSEARWFGRRCDGATYPTRIDHAVAMANAHGLYVILELHWTDLSGTAPCDADCPIGLEPMPDQESLVFWRQVAARYANNPGVVFDLFDEPGPSTGAGADADWTCWRDGGCQLGASTVSGVTYTATGMQPLFDVVRSAAPQSVVVVAGAELATDLSRIAQGYALNGAHIVYAAHMYSGRGFGAADWLARFGALAATYPIMVNELGSLDCTANDTSQLFTYLDAPLTDTSVRISWGIRSWNQPGNCGYPSIIGDFAGAPLGDQGALVRDHLRAYGVSAGPVPP